MNQTAVIPWVCFVLLAGCAGQGASLHGPERHGADPATLRSTEVERVAFFTTYGYRDAEEDEWIIPIRYWVHEDRETTLRLVTRLTSELHDLDSKAREFFHQRAAAFVADSESLERVEIRFHNDPRDEVYLVRDEAGNALRTGLNGTVDGEIRISSERAIEIREVQEDADGWLTWRAVSPEHQGEGRALLVERRGISVISDIDDTVRITGIPEGWSTVVHRTFFREFVEAPGMADLYRGWAEAEDAVFHYVSGTPWQLYEPLSDFLFSEEVGFPRGSMHLREVRKNLLSFRTWTDLVELVSSGANTPERKYAVIAEKLERFPQRHFRLVGDTGEGDPEIYRRLAREFPEQIIEIVMRDVTGDRIHRPERVAGMTVIPAASSVPSDSLSPADPPVCGDSLFSVDSQLQRGSGR